MIRILASPESRIVHRLALGIEPLDAAMNGRLPFPVRIDVEGELPWRPGVDFDSHRSYGATANPGDARPVITRHDTGRFSLLYRPSVQSPVDVRIYDHRRRYVPRRLRIPLVALEDVLAAEEAGQSLAAAPRIREPFMFPGAAYNVVSTVTALRGRILRDGVPMRWARVEAFLAADVNAANPVVIGRAHGDDRGEFLLLLTSRAVLGGELPDTLDVELVIYGPEPAPQPATPDLPAADIWWDLPLEILPNPGQDDTVSTGEENPVNYVRGGSQVISFVLGQTISAADGIPDFSFVPGN